MSFATLLTAVLPVYFLALIGVFLRRQKILTTEMEKGMLKVVIHCLYPALILDKLLGNPLVRTPSVVISGIGVGFGIIVTGFLLAYVIGRLLRLERGTGLRTFALSGGVQNYGYTAIPILVVLFSNPDTLGILFVHSLGVELALWTVGLMLLKGSFRPQLHLFFNGPIIAVVSGLTLVYTGYDSLFSSNGPLLGQVTRQSMNWLGGCAFPIAILLIGGTIYDLIGQERLSAKISFGAIIIRCLIMPAIILILAKHLPLIIELKQVLLVQASMPAGVTPVVIARHYGGRPGVAVQIIIATSLLGILTIPLILKWGAAYIGI